ncbi:MAG: zinc ribbon domain-containing protein [Microcystaceae cyanobacterium]
MNTCPKCHQTIDSQAVICPYCQETLKAFGHPGMPLYQANKGEYLCDNCIYHADDSCDFPQRPYAKTCTLYQSPEMAVSDKITQPLYPTAPIQKIKVWSSRHRRLLLLMAILLVSLVITLIRF